MQRITNHYALFYLGLDRYGKTHNTAHNQCYYTTEYMSPYCDARRPPPMLMFDG